MAKAKQPIIIKLKKLNPELEIVRKKRELYKLKSTKK
jgi:hypothetical protein